MKTVSLEKKTVNLEGKTFKLSKKTIKVSKKLPDLETMFEDEGDPLEDVEYNPDDLETSANNEMSELVRQIKEQKKARLDAFRTARDPEYWVSLCFQFREQRDLFLELTGWGPEGEKYLNGLEIARRLNLSIPFTDMKPLKLRGNPKKYSRKEVI